MIRLLSPDHLRAFLDDQTWRDNPFAIREARRDRKRLQATRLFFWMALVMLCCIGGATVGLIACDKRLGRIPWYLGGDPFVALLIVVSGIHCWFIAGASQRNTARMLRQEAFKNTLMHLIMLPMSPFQVVLEVSLHAWREGMRVAFALLPFYVFLAAIDKISWLDLLMLYVVFGVISLNFPFTRRPMLADDVTTAAISPPLTRTPGNAALAQATRRQQQNQNANSGGWIAIACLWPMLISFFALVNGRGGAGLLRILHRYLPDSLISLMPTSLLSWPLLIARGAITPLDWFGHHVPPVFFGLALFALSRYTQMVRTSEYLQVGLFRDLAFLPTYLPRRRLENALRLAQLFVITGYLWHWGIYYGGLNQLSNGATGPGSGLPGFAYALLFLLGWVVMTRMSLLAGWKWAEGAKRLLAVRKYPVKHGIRYAVGPFVYLIGFYLACCLVSGTVPFPPGVRAIAGPMLAICCVGGLLSFGIDSLFGALGILIRITLPALFIVGFGYYHLAAIKPLETLSPTLGLLSLQHPLPFGISLPTDLFTGFRWQDWVVRSGTLGALLTFAGTIRFAFRKSPLTEETLTLDPTVYGLDVFTDPPLPKEDAKRTQEETPLCRNLIRIIQKVADNALTVKEVRVRLRGSLNGATLRNLAIAALLLSIGIYIVFPEIPRLFAEELAVFLFGQAHSNGVQIVADMEACWLIALLIVAGFGGFVTARAFLIERDKSTLGFILLTPMSDSAIVLGKAIGILLSPGVYLLGLALWTLGMSLFLIPRLGSAAVTGWTEFVGSAALLFLAVGMTTLAISTLFLRWKIPPGCWVGFIVVFQVSLSQVGTIINFIVDYVEQSTGIKLYGFTGMQIWKIAVGICVFLILASYLTAVRSIHRLRTKDLTFVGAKTEN